MFKRFSRTKGDAKAKFLVFAIIVGIIAWISVKMATPQIHFKKLQGTMQYWADIVIARGNVYDYRDLQSNVEDIIYKYNLPIQPEEVYVFYDDYTKVLKVWVQTIDYTTNTQIDGYKIDVKFPGYVYTYHFKPQAEAIFSN